MVVANPLKVGLTMTAFLLLMATPVHADSSNPEDGPEAEPSSDDEQGPCSVILIGTQAPYVDPHPECLDQFPGNATLVSFA